jgi:hypothetical protein
VFQKRKLALRHEELKRRKKKKGANTEPKSRRKGKKKKKKTLPTETAVSRYKSYEEMGSNVGTEWTSTK